VTRKTIGKDPIGEVVSVHLDAFPHFFMSQLGPRFLAKYYRCVAEYPSGVLLTESCEEQCVGFVAGFIDPASFYTELRRRRLGLGMAALAGVCAKPRRLFTLIENYRRASVTARAVADKRTAELASLAVLSRVAGRGIGARLVCRFVKAVAEMGADRVILTTDACGNDRVNGFYRRLGFDCKGTFEARRGRVLNDYRLEIRRGSS
jgi:ribosomal protein S18 acetylase RimI-like enzyme